MTVTLDKNAAEYTANLIAELRAENDELRRILAETRHELNQMRVRLTVRASA